MGQKVSIKDKDKVIAQMGKEVQKAINAGALSAGYRLVSHILNVIIPNEPRMPVDRGIYRGAWRVKGLKDGAYVYNTSPHGNLIEKGVKGNKVKPGRGMLIALAGWVKRKGLVTGNGPSADAEARSIAWAIAMSMKKKGIFNMGAGLKILEKGSRELPRFIQEEVAKEIKKRLFMK